MTLLADIVDASRAVAETSSRSRKVAILAELLRRLEPDEVPLAVGFLAGVPRQGRVGIGYSTIYGIERVPAGEATLTVDQLDRVITEVQPWPPPALGGGRSGELHQPSPAGASERRPD